MLPFFDALTITFFGLIVFCEAALLMIVIRVRARSKMSQTQALWPFVLLFLGTLLMGMGLYFQDYGTIPWHGIIAVICLLLGACSMSLSAWFNWKQIKARGDTLPTALTRFFSGRSQMRNSRAVSPPDDV